MPSFDLDTKACHNRRPLTSTNPMASTTLLSAFTPLVKKFVNEGQKYQPEMHAVQFYTLNHLVAEMTKELHDDEPLGPRTEVFDTYYETATKIAAVAVSYLIVICVQEARHASWSAALDVKVKAASNDKTLNFFKDINNMGRPQSREFLINKPPHVTLDKFMSACSAIFYHKGAFGGAYGGPKWGAISDCLRDYYKGITTLEMVCDTVWTLAHNGGPIFNKQTIYHQYDGGLLLRVLDVQRAGQMPTALVWDSKIRGVMEEDFVDWVRKIDTKYRLNCIKQAVDWHAVKDAGALGNYMTEINSTPKTPAQLAAEEKKLQIAADKAAAEKEKKEWYSIGTDKFKKVERAGLD